MESNALNFKPEAVESVKFTVKNINKNSGTYELHINSDDLKEDEYPPINLNLSDLRPEDQEPIAMQIARYAFAHAEQLHKREQNVSGKILSLASIVDTEMEISSEDMMKHKEAMWLRESSHLNPIMIETQTRTHYTEDDLDGVFEQLSEEAKAE
jgi:hypothetical protein